MLSHSSDPRRRRCSGLSNAECRHIDQSDVWLTVHRNSVWIRNQLVVTFVLSFISPLEVAQHVSGKHVPIFRSWRLRSVKSDVWLTVHRNSVWIRNQLDVTFVLSFISPLQVAQHVSGKHVPIFRSWRLRSVKSDVWLTVHRNSVWIRNQLYVTFVLSFISPLQVAQHVSGKHVPIYRSWRAGSVSIGYTTC